MYRYLSFLSIYVNTDISSFPFLLYHFSVYHYECHCFHSTVVNIYIFTYIYIYIYICVCVLCSLV